MESAINKKRRQNKLEVQNIGYLLIAPSIIIYVVFVIMPILWSVIMSFMDYNLKEYHFIGLTNYISLFKDEVFLLSLWNTIYYSLLTILPTMVLGLSLAMLLNRKIYGRGAFRTLFYLPNILSVVAISMAWIYLYDTNAGILNMVLKSFNLSPVAWVSSTKLSMISVAVMSIWQGLGYDMILFLAGLQSIPEYLYEAADVDGAKFRTKFFKVMLPMLSPTTFFVFVMACIRSFQVFGQVLIVTNGGPINSTTTIAHQIYLNGFQYYKMGYASSQAVILMLIILFITLVNLKYGKGGDIDLG